MRLRDRVTLAIGGGRDTRGNPIPYVDHGPYRAEVQPLNSAESVAAGVPPLSTYYRLVLEPAGQILTSTSRVKWRGRTFAVDGDVEPHTVRGRLHHLEVTLRGT